jgi:hypothetical protein
MGSIQYAKERRTHSSPPKKIFIYKIPGPDFFTFGSVPEGILPGSGRFLSAVAVSITDMLAVVLLLLLLLLLLGAL